MKYTLAAILLFGIFGYICQALVVRRDEPCEALCKKECPYGFLPEGCPRCTCAPDPCEPQPCNEYERCVAFPTICPEVYGCPWKPLCRG